MDFFLILPYYFLWHYTKAFVDISNISKNFLVFTYNFFSIGSLSKSLFSPWRRMNDAYSKDESFVATAIFNTIMRILGAIIRLSIILVGVACLFVLVFLILVFYVFWILMPAILVLVLFWGTKSFVIKN